jgi:hypothetical protein
MANFSAQTLPILLCRCRHKLRQLLFYTIVSPGACIIKCIAAVIYGFCFKLEHLSLNTRLDLKGLPGTNTPAYYGNHKLRP